MFFWNYCFFYDLVDVGNLISGSSTFSSLTWRILSVALLACEMSAIACQFEHSLALPFFGIELKTEVFIINCSKAILLHSFYQLINNSQSNSSIHSQLDSEECLSIHLHLSFISYSNATKSDLYFLISPVLLLLDTYSMCACSVMSNSLQPHGLQPTRFCCPWNFPGKNIVVGCHFLLQGLSPIQGWTPCLLHLLHWQASS